MLTRDELASVGNLVNDKGYLLLLDLLQARMDDHLAELADPRLADGDSLNRLRHWRAMREIYADLLNQPQAYAHQAAMTPEDPAIPETLLIRTNAGFQVPPSPIVLPARK